MLWVILVEFRVICIFNENITLKVVLIELELFLVQTSTDYKKKNTVKENFVRLVTQLIALFLPPC